MTYDLNAYRHTVKPQIKSWCNYKSQEDPHSMIGALAVATDCPIVAICYFVAELYGMTNELQTKIQRLEHFYKVDAVLGKL